MHIEELSAFKSFCKVVTNMAHKIWFEANEELNVKKYILLRTVSFNLHDTSWHFAFEVSLHIFHLDCSQS